MTLEDALRHYYVGRWLLVDAQWYTVQCSAPYHKGRLRLGRMKAAWVLDNRRNEFALAPTVLSLYAAREHQEHIRRYARAEGEVLLQAQREAMEEESGN